VHAGQVEITFRGATSVARARRRSTSPANAPHRFENVAAGPARLLCILRAGRPRDAIFLEIGQRVTTGRAPPPAPRRGDRAALVAKTLELAPRSSELLLPYRDAGRSTP
jgi:hypothetical protein